MPLRHIFNITEAETSNGSVVPLHYSACKPKGEELETLRTEGPLFPKNCTDDLDTFESEETAQTAPPASKPETKDDDAASEGEDKAAIPFPTECVPKSLPMTHPTEVTHATKNKNVKIKTY